MKKNLFLTFALAFAATFAIAQETQTPKDPAQQTDPAAQTKPDDKSTTPAQDTTGAQSANKQSSSKDVAEGQSKSKASKSAVSQQLHDKFAADPALANVKFHVNKGVVTLVGKVDSADEVARAKELAMSVDGVKSVRNHLKVAGTSAAAGSDTHANNSTAEAKNTTPDADKNAAGEQGINPNASGSPAKDASGTNAATSAGGNTSITPTTTASGAAAPSAAGSIAGNTSAASGTQTSSGTTRPSSGSSSLPASDQNAPAGASSMPQSSASGDSATLQTTIQDKLKGEPLLSSSNVNVNVTDSTIELSGTVSTGKEKQTAVRIAQSYAGNRKVVDRITVTGKGNDSSSGQATPIQPNGSVPTSANPSTPKGPPPTNQTPPTPEQSTQPK
jgi:osmotically-inducible protein OsmY